MTSKERISASVHHRLPDKVPVDLGGSNVTGISAIANGHLKKEFGRDITFRGGGVETSRILNRGSSEEVRKDVLNRCGTRSQRPGRSSPGKHPGRLQGRTGVRQLKLNFL